MKKSVTGYNIHAIILAVMSLISVPFFLMYYDVIGRSLQSFLHLKTGPSFSGGKIAAVFHDPAGDDHGFGGLRYPVSFGNPGSLDLVRYTVRQPVKGFIGPGIRDYWQLDFSFMASGDKRNIRVYFGAENAEGGSAQTKKEFAEGVGFAKDAPWQYVLSVRDGSGTIESFDGSFKADVRVFPSRSGTDLSVRIPLTDQALRFLYNLPTLNQYILIGALDASGRDGFADMTESEFAPKLYDVLVPEGSSQERDLSAWNEDDFTIPVLSPVMVRLSDLVESDRKAVKATTEALAKYEELKKAVEAESAARERDALAKYESKPADAMEYALAAFDAGKYGEAEGLFDAILAKDGKAVGAMAYKGSLLALRGGDASPLEAVGLIKEAYVWLDRAVAAASNDVEICDAYLNRANVSMAIPNSIFGMASSGGDDFLKASESIRNLIRDGNDLAGLTAEDVVDSLANAAKCYETAGETDKAETWYREAKRLLEGIDPQRCAQARLDVFRYYEIGSDKTVESANKAQTTEKGDTSATERKANEKELERTLAALEAAPDDLKLVETALRLQVLGLDKIEDALKLSESHESLIADSMAAQLFVAIAECKMATVVKKIVDKVDWINKGMRRFEAVQRRWPDDEMVYTYETLTYSYFPSEMGMCEQVLDLLSVIEKNYAGGKWTLTEEDVDFIWLIFANLQKNYLKKPESDMIREKAKVISEKLEIMKQRPMAAEVLHE